MGSERYSWLRVACARPASSRAAATRAVATTALQAPWLHPPCLPKQRRQAHTRQEASSHITNEPPATSVQQVIQKFTEHEEESGRTTTTSRTHRFSYVQEIA